MASSRRKLSDAREGRGSGYAVSGSDYANQSRTVSLIQINMMQCQCTRMKPRKIAKSCCRRDDAGDPLDGPEPKENPLRARKVYSSSGHLTLGQKVYASNNVREERTRREDTVET